MDSITPADAVVCNAFWTQKSSKKYLNFLCEFGYFRFCRSVMGMSPSSSTLGQALDAKTGHLVATRKLVRQADDYLGAGVTTTTPATCSKPSWTCAPGRGSRFPRKSLSGEATTTPSIGLAWSSRQEEQGRMRRELKLSRISCPHQ